MSLAAVLEERDRRAAETAALIASGARAVVRLSARMPAALRARGLADRPLGRGAESFVAACLERGLALEEAGRGRGALGPWRLWTSAAAPAELKRAGLAVEEGSPYGALLDLDVAAAEGPLGREALGLPPRPCLVCGAPAAACVGRGRHAPAEVESAFAALLGLPGGTETGSRDGSAVGAAPSMDA